MEIQRENDCLKCVCDTDTPHTNDTSHQKTSPKSIIDMCAYHPALLNDISCMDCEERVCRKCITEKHNGHKTNISDVITSKYDDYEKYVEKIKDEILPKCRYQLDDIKEDMKNCKLKIPDLRQELVSSAQVIKDIVDDVLDEHLKVVDEIESSITKELERQIETLKSYIEYLQHTVEEFENTRTKSEFISLHQTYPFDDIKSIPQLPQISFPTFKSGPEDKQAIKTQFGHICKTNSTKMRKFVEINPLPSKMVSLKLASAVTEVKNFAINNIRSVGHITYVSSNVAWISDISGKIVLANSEGNEFQRIETEYGFGYHTLSKTEELLLSDNVKKRIIKLKSDNTQNILLSTAEWKPTSIYSSKQNGDLLVGLSNDSEGKLVRYDRRGKERCRIEYDNNNERLFSHPIYITENLNSDVCVSDDKKRLVVVVDKIGRHRFTYKGHPKGSSFLPRGVCTDILLNILISVYTNHRLHMINKDGEFLLFLLTRDDGIKFPLALSTDNDYNLWLGQLDKNTVSVYKYLEECNENDE